MRWEFTQKNVAIIAVTGALILGIIWEVFEVTNGITFFSDGVLYLVSTSSDLLMDVSGGIVASIYAWKIISRQTQTDI